MEIGILADSHLNFSGNRDENPTYTRILKGLSQLFASVDHIIHAGDVVMEGFIEDLEQLAPVSVVRGNCDSNPLWPKILSLEFEGVSIGIAHEPELYAHFKEKPRVFIHGHTHIADIRDLAEGTLLINPGSLTRPRHRMSRQAGFQLEESPRPSVGFLFIEKANINALIKKI